MKAQYFIVIFLCAQIVMGNAGQHPMQQLTIAERTKLLENERKHLDDLQQQLKAARLDLEKSKIYAKNARLLALKALLDTRETKEAEKH